MTAYIVPGCVGFYVAVALAVARARYRVIRPWTEPAACTTPQESRCERGEHYADCYRRYRRVSTQGDAVGEAMRFGLVWPFHALAAVVFRIITGGDRVLPEERALKTRRQENELARLRNEQENAS